MKKIVTVYTYDELDPKAQEKARDKYHEHAWHDLVYTYLPFVIEDAVEVAEILGISIKAKRIEEKNRPVRFEHHIWWEWEEIEYGVPWVSFDGTYSHAKGASTLIRDEYGDPDLHGIADGLTALQEKYSGTVSASIEGSRSSMHIQIEPEAATIDVDGFWEYAEMADDDVDSLEGFFIQFCRWIVQRLTDERDYRLDPDTIAQEFRENDALFDKTGDRADWDLARMQAVDMEEAKDVTIS